MKVIGSVVSLLLVLVMLGSVVSPVFAVSTPKMKPIMTIQRTELHKNVNIVKIDPILENATPYWMFIAAGSTEKGSVTILKYIDSSKNLTKRERVELKKFVRELWRKYRVKTIRNGNVTLITLNSKAGINLTNEEKVMLEKVAQAMNEYFREKYVKNKNGNVGILWNGNEHKSIIRISCIKWGGISKDYASVAGAAAPKPDTWTQVPPPHGYPDWMWNFIMQVVHSWTHYYNPDWGTGSAPSETKYYADIAKDKHSNGDYTSAYTNLGYASHFMTDVGNPLHTGAEFRQVFLSKLRFGDIKYIHTAYENYVTDNWNSGYVFKSIVENNWYYYPISNPEQATKNLASYTHQYADTIVWTIFTNPDTWQNDQNIKNITENCLLETAKYVLGLVKYVRG